MRTCSGSHQSLPSSRSSAAAFSSIRPRLASRTSSRARASWSSGVPGLGGDGPSPPRPPEPRFPAGEPSPGLWIAGRWAGPSAVRVRRASSSVPASWPFFEDGVSPGPGRGGRLAALFLDEPEVDGGVGADPVEVGAGGRRGEAGVVVADRRREVAARRRRVPQGVIDLHPQRRVGAAAGVARKEPGPLDNGRAERASPRRHRPRRGSSARFARPGGTNPAPRR